MEKIKNPMLDKIIESYIFYENQENEIIMKYINMDLNNFNKKLKEDNFSVYLTKNDKFKIERSINLLENNLMKFNKIKEEILNNMNVLDSNYYLIKEKSEEFTKRNTYFIQLLNYY